MPEFLQIKVLPLSIHSAWIVVMATFLGNPKMKGTTCSSNVLNWTTPDLGKAPIQGQLESVYTKSTTFPLTTLRRLTSAHTFYSSITFSPLQKYQWPWSLCAEDESCFADFYCCIACLIESLEYRYPSIYSCCIQNNACCLETNGEHHPILDQNHLDNFEWKVLSKYSNIPLVKFLFHIRALYPQNLDIDILERHGNDSNALWHAL